MIVFFALLSNGIQFFTNCKEFDAKYVGGDGITAYEKRFDGVKSILPSAGIVGYISDGQPYNMEFFLTQYVLSPIIIDPNQPREVVIGNFVNRAADFRTVTKMNLALRKDFGNGVKLFNLESK